jgi:polar amino acid transport system substrate-binding protein
VPPAIAQSPIVPSFWDLQRRAEKPDVSVPRQLRLVTDDDYPPFNFALPDGTPSGFNVELARALCEELQITCTIQVRRFEAIPAALKDGSADVAVDSIAPRGAMAQGLDFTAPYYRTPARFVGRADMSAPEPLPENLRNLAVGVRRGSAHEAYLRAAFPQARPIPYDSDEALRAALVARDVPLIFGDGIGLSIWLASPQSNGCCMFRGGPWLDERFMGAGIGMALRQNRRDLRRLLDDGMRRVAARGRYAEIYLKYFPVSFF